jgi:uncharacterized protein YraI
MTESQENHLQDPPENSLQDPPENHVEGLSENHLQDPPESHVQGLPDKWSRSTVQPALLIAAAIAVLLVLALLFLVLSGSLAGPRATARTLTDVNLRQGPGIGYQTVGAFSQGTKVKVVGRNEDGSWLLVETKDGGQAWMTSIADYVEIDQAALDRLPVVESSGSAYDASNPAVSRVVNEIPLVVYHADHFTCASHAGLNNLLPQVAEGNVIGPHAGDFAYADKEGNVLFKYTGGTFVLIRDNPIARFEGDLESLPLDKALQMFADGRVVWTGEPGRWPGRGVPGCDPASKPD